MLKVFSLDGKAPPREVPAGELPALIASPEGVFWADFEAPTEEEAHLLLDAFHFHPVAVEDALVDTLHPKVDDYGDYLYIVLHGVANEKVGADLAVDLQELDFFLGKRFLVTHHDARSASLAAARERLARKPESIHGADGLFAAIVEALTDRYLPIIESFDDRIDALEDTVFEGAGSAILEHVFAAKRSTLKLRRTIVPQREVIRNLSAGQYAIVGREARFQLRDVHDHLFTISEMVETYRDLLSGTLEAHLSVTSNRLNLVMKRLTVITTVLMVIATWTGVYGMNFDYMPFLHVHWGFWAFGGVMALSALATLAILRMLEWS